MPTFSLDKLSSIIKIKLKLRILIKLESKQSLQIYSFIIVLFIHLISLKFHHYLISFHWKIYWKICFQVLFFNWTSFVLQLNKYHFHLQSLRLKITHLVNALNFLLHYFLPLLQKLEAIGFISFQWMFHIGTNFDSIFSYHNSKFCYLQMFLIKANF